MKNEVDSEKAKLKFLIITLIGILLVGLVIGISLLVTLSNYIFISLFFINYFFMIFVCFLLKVFYKNFSNKPNIKTIVSLFGRFAIAILAIGLTFLFLYLTKNVSKPNIFYIFISPIMLTGGYILGIIFK